MRRDTLYHTVFSLNAGKYGPEITPYLDDFHAVADWGKFCDRIRYLVDFSDSNKDALSGLTQL